MSEDQTPAIAETPAREAKSKSASRTFTSRQIHQMVSTFSYRIFGPADAFPLKLAQRLIRTGDLQSLALLIISLVQTQLELVRRQLADANRLRHDLEEQLREQRQENTRLRRELAEKTKLVAVPAPEQEQQSA